MSKYGSNSDLCKFLIDQSDSYNAIFDRVKIFALTNKQTLDFRDEDFRSGYITLEEINCKFAENMCIANDKVDFDVIIEGEFSVKKRYRGDYDNATESLWFRLNCNMTITDKLEWFSVKDISEYSNERRKNNPFPATVNFVPVICKEQFDSEAERFLQKWFPLALETPMPVPIEAIVQNKMGLTVIKDKNLTKDFKIFGQICFSNGNIKTYNEDDDCYVDTPVKRGMVFIDPNTFFLRNLGCVNNTLAHEAFHWERHRIYATIRNLLTKEKTVACRCPTSPRGNVIKDLLTEDEDWMEWQANGIAPKILMPKNMAIQKAKELVAAHGYVLGTSDCYEILKQIIDEMADFFTVSKQAAKIRMIEIGYPEAENIYNYEAEFAYLSNEISVAEAIFEYENNKDFRALLDLDLFRYVEGCFVVNDKKYISTTDNDELVLTECAKNNLNECSLQFTYNLVSLFKHSRSQGVLFRPSGQFGEVAKYKGNEQNERIIDFALEAAKIKQEVAQVKEITDTAVQMICKWMQIRKWNSAIFKDKTFLSADYYSKLQKHPNKQMKLPQLVSVCFGLQLEESVALDIIQKAGFNLVSTNVEHVAYRRILSPIFRGKTIYDCNDFLEECKNELELEIHLLGAQDYKTSK